jgi:predicted nuclease of predicted toxin-antitoxin system
MGISPRTVNFLRSLGNEVLRLPEIGLEKASDRQVIEHASKHGQIVLTFDFDYPALLALRLTNRASAIVFRTANADPAWINARLRQSIPAMEEALAEGAIVIIEDDRMRIRKFSAEF